MCKAVLTEESIAIVQVILAFTRWIFILIAVILFINGTSNSAQIAYLVFAGFDLLVPILYLLSVVFRNRPFLYKILLGSYWIIIAILSIIHYITTSCAFALRPTSGSHDDTVYLAGTIMGFIGAVLTSIQVVTTIYVIIKWKVIENDNE